MLHSTCQLNMSTNGASCIAFMRNTFNFGEELEVSKAVAFVHLLENFNLLEVYVKLDQSVILHEVSHRLNCCGHYFFKQSELGEQ